MIFEGDKALTWLLFPESRYAEVRKPDLYIFLLHLGDVVNDFSKIVDTWFTASG
jgi:hypothetical protein